MIQSSTSKQIPSVNQLLRRTSLYSLRSISIPFGISLFFLVGGTILSGDLLFGLAFGAIPLMVALVMIGLRLYVANKLKKMLRDSATLHWQYTHEDWESYLKVERSQLNDRRVFEPKLILASVGLGVVSGGGMFLGLMGIDGVQLGPVAIFCAVFGLIAGTALFLVFAGKIALAQMRYRAKSKQIGDAFLGDEGFCFFHDLVFWNRWNAKLASVSAVRCESGYEELEIRVVFVNSTPISGVGSFSRHQAVNFFIPISQGEFDNATNYANRFG